jgi:hypothetical protein
MANILSLETVVREGKRSTLFGTQDDERIRLANDANCDNCGRTPGAVEYVITTEWDHKTLVPLCGYCVTVCEHGDCEELILPNGYTGDTYETGAGINTAPDCYSGRLICTGCWEDDYSRCECCEHEVPHAEMGRYAAPITMCDSYGDASPDDPAPGFLGDEDARDWAEFIERCDPSLGVIYACNDCSDDLAHDVTNSADFRAWREARADEREADGQSFGGDWLRVRNATEQLAEARLTLDAHEVVTAS